MGYHVKLEELHNISSNIIDQTEAWIKQLSRVRASLLDIVHVDMHGEAADAIRAYIQEVHIKILDWILDTIKTYRSSLILYVDGYREIEPDPKGEISQGVLEEQLEQLQREKSEFLQIAENIEQIYRELSQYMAVDGFCAAGVENSYDNAIQFAEKVRTQVGEYEEVHRHDVDSIDEMISNIEHIMNLHSGGN
ncbi:MAG: LXG domain-containing protein, partial [Lachnospiraceae bacterium]|nr:LXG domain-containing protein [Lachnospiraceae bacterium]